LKWLASKQNWRKWGDRTMSAVAVAAAPLDDAERANNASAVDEFMSKIERLAANRRGMGMSEEEDDAAVTIIPPVLPLRRPEPPAVREKPAMTEGTVVTPAPAKAEFSQLKCTSERPFEPRFRQRGLSRATDERA
jgi:hypothetical protein